MKSNVRLRIRASELVFVHIVTVTVSKPVNIWSHFKAVSDTQLCGALVPPAGGAFTCLPLWVTEDRIVRSVLKPMAMSSRWAAKKKLLKCPKMDMVVYQIRYRKFCRQTKKLTKQLLRTVQVNVADKREKGYRITLLVQTLIINQAFQSLYFHQSGVNTKCFQYTWTKLTLSVKTTPNFQMWYFVSIELSLSMRKHISNKPVSLYQGKRSWIHSGFL